MDGEGQVPDDLEVNLRWPDADEPRPEGDIFGHTADQDETVVEQDDDAPPPPDVATPATLDLSPPPATASSDAVAPPPQGGSVVAADLQRVSASLAAVNQRIDALTDATVTLRGLVNERVADVGDAVSRLRTQTNQDLEDALARVQGLAQRELESAVGKVSSGVTRELDDALNRLRNQTSSDIDESVTVTVAEVVRGLQHDLGRLRSDVGEQVDDALARIRLEISRELEDVVGRSRAQTTQDLDEILVRVGTQTSRDLQHNLSRLRTDLGEDLEEHRRRQDAVVADLSAPLASTEEGVRRLNQASTVLASELTSLGQRLGEGTEAATEATKIVVRSGSDRLSTELDELGQSVATALSEVALHLERLVAINGSQRKATETNAEAIEVMTSRFDEVAQAQASRQSSVNAALNELRGAMPVIPPFADELQPLRSSMAKIEVLVEAIAETSDEPSALEERANAAMDRLERLSTTVSDRVSRVTSSAVKALSEASERAVEQVKAAVPPPDRSGTAALTRLEERVAELTRQRNDLERKTAGKLDSLEETIGRLATAQAEDLERILDTVENTVRQETEATTAPAVDDGRLQRIEEALNALGEHRVEPEPPRDEAAQVAEQLAALSRQVETLRRRLPLRARQGSGLDAAGMTELADLIVARMAGAQAQPDADVPHLPES